MEILKRLQELKGKYFKEEDVISIFNSNKNGVAINKVCGGEIKIEDYGLCVLYYIYSRSGASSVYCMWVEKHNRVVDVRTKNQIEDMYKNFY